MRAFVKPAEQAEGVPSSGRPGRSPMPLRPRRFAARSV